MIYSFGPFRYDASQRLLFRGGELFPLPPKALETLHVLLEQRGSIVEKSDLMKLVWPDTNVEEVGLARNISLLRKALEEDPAQPYIETIPRRGYRFVAPVSEPSQAATAAPPRPRPSRLWWILSAAVAVLMAVVYYQFYVPSRYLGAHPAASLAVVPFDCLCSGMDGAAFSQGLDEVLVAGLSKLPAVQVVAPSTVRRHQRMGVSMGLMGRLLGLDALVEGAVQNLGPRLRITARLVDVHTGRIIWADTIEAPSADPGAAQQTAANAIVTAVAAALHSSRNLSEANPKALPAPSGAL